MAVSIAIYTGAHEKVRMSSRRKKSDSAYMTLQDPCVGLALFIGWATKVYGPCRIACAITILSPGVIEIRGFLVYDKAAAFEGVIMWEGSIRPRGGDVFIGKTHVILRLSPELCQPPGGFPLRDFETLGHLLIKPSEELDVTGAVTQVCALESLDFNFVFDALHLLNDRGSERVTIVRQHKRDGV
jgi:hypothetical protein